MNNSKMAQVNATGSIDKDWWRGAVIYQVYPRSYQDTNGDGIGDLKGIVKRLPYIASLGVDAIWISPFFTSPMKDFGYDVSDYCDVDPMFGTLADFDELIASAHSMGVKIIIDQVLSHTADQHAWFEESRQSLNNPKSDWYVWSDPQPDGTPPNNWLSIFGGPAWHWDTRREQYYFHNFLASQPDLNFHNPDVQQALLDVCRFWLDRGVDGFRLDTINFYFADKKLRSNPALTKEERNASIAPSVNPYNHQNHLHSKNQPENIAFLERFRALLDEYPAATSVGEVGDAQLGLELMKEYTQGDKRVHMCYSFEFLSAEKLDSDRLKLIFDRYDALGDAGWACWALTNHDIQRHATRWELDADGLRVYALLMMCLRGSICFYQGEELGLPEADIKFEELQDPYGIEFWPEFKGRDGCRTPMAWESGKANAGFSDAKPWLPVPTEHAALSVGEQEKSNGSLLHYYRKAIAFRKTLPALIKGTQTPIEVDGEVVSFVREHNGQRVLCILNLGSSSAKVSLPDGKWELIGTDLGTCNSQEKNRATLKANQALLALGS